MNTELNQREMDLVCGAKDADDLIQIVAQIINERKFYPHGLDYDEEEELDRAGLGVLR